MGLQANPRTAPRGAALAIYSLHHTPIGKSTQAQPYTAAAHIRYITRKDALSAIRQARFPGRTPREISDYLRRGEDTDRKNARVVDKVMLALPRELTADQQITLVKDFAEHVTKGRAPWLAAFHTKGKDVKNPHCHLVIRDRDPGSGKRVIGTSEIGSTERLRRQWEEYANRALSRAGHQERVDRRTLAAQGIAREPTIHEGPQAQAMDRRGFQPKSRLRRRRNRPRARRSHRDIDYRKIDKGQSRPQENRVRRANARETERDYWNAIDQDAQGRELSTLRAIHNPRPSELVEMTQQVGLSSGIWQPSSRNTTRASTDRTPARLAEHPLKKAHDTDRQRTLSPTIKAKGRFRQPNREAPASDQLQQGTRDREIGRDR